MKGIATKIQKEKSAGVNRFATVAAGISLRRQAEHRGELHRPEGQAGEEPEHDQRQQAGPGLAQQRTDAARIGQQQHSDEEGGDSEADGGLQGIQT